MSTKPLVSVITANSNTGRYCIEELFGKYADNVRVRGVFRSEEKAGPFRQKYPSLDVVSGVDASKPETLSKAFQQAQAALIVTPNEPGVEFDTVAEYTKNMINSAVENGVNYIVWIGGFTVHNPRIMNKAGPTLISVENHLAQLGKEKGLKWTVLRGGSFMENTLRQAKSIKEGVYSITDSNTPHVYTKDIGRSAAACLGQPNSYDKHNGKAYEMSGPEKHTGEQLAEIFSKVLNKKVVFKPLKLEDIKRFMPEGIAEIYQAMQEDESVTPFTDHVKQLTGQWTDFETFVRDHASDFS